jgi:hypothetical protein
MMGQNTVNLQSVIMEVGEAIKEVVTRAVELHSQKLRGS